MQSLLFLLVSAYHASCRHLPSPPSPRFPISYHALVPFSPSLLSTTNQQPLSSLCLVIPINTSYQPPISPLSTHPYQHPLNVPITLSQPPYLGTFGPQANPLVQQVTSPTPNGEYTLGDSLLIYVVFDKLIMFDPSIRHIIKMLMELSSGNKTMTYMNNPSIYPPTP